MKKKLAKIDKAEGAKKLNIKKRKNKKVVKKEINVTFGLFEPDEADFHSVRMFIAQAWEWSQKTIVDASELADVIVNQGNIGNVIKSENADDGNAFGLLTIINLGQYEKDKLRNTVPAIKELIRSKCKKMRPDLLAKVEACLDTENKHVGYLINEHITGIPIEHVVGSHNNLHQDVHWSQTTPECPKDEQPYYFFDYLIGIAPSMRQQKKEKVFLRFEDEAYVKNSTFNFSFPAKDHLMLDFFCVDLSQLSLEKFCGLISEAAKEEKTLGAKKVNKENAEA